MKLKLPLFLIWFLLILSFSSCLDQFQHDYSERLNYFGNLNSGGTYHEDSPFVCVTFNIHLGFKAEQDPWDKDEEGADLDHVKELANVLGQIDPDVIALQEVPYNRYNARISDFIKALAEEMDMNYAYGANGYNDPYGIVPVEGQWGNAILSKYPIETIHNEEIEYFDVWERRSLLNANIRLNDSLLIHALSTHHLPSEQGIPNTAAYVKTLSHPVILMGDFNYLGSIEQFMKVGLKDVDSLYDEHGVDRVFIDKSAFQVKQIGSLPDPNRISDHPANYCILEWR